MWIFLREHSCILQEPWLLVARGHLQGCRVSFLCKGAGDCQHHGFPKTLATAFWPAPAKQRECAFWRLQQFVFGLNIWILSVTYHITQHRGKGAETCCGRVSTACSIAYMHMRYNRAEGLYVQINLGKCCVLIIHPFAESLRNSEAQRSSAMKSKTVWFCVNKEFIKMWKKEKLEFGALTNRY